VVSSWPKFVSRCKSRLSALGRSCYLRRQHWHRKYEQGQHTQRELQETIANCQARCRQLEQQNQDLGRQVAELQSQLAAPRPFALPVGNVPSGQQYGANLMVLSVNLGRKLGVRPAARALKIFSRG
jgi:hypothetical protein